MRDRKNIKAKQAFFAKDDVNRSAALTIANGGFWVTRHSNVSRTPTKIADALPSKLEEVHIRRQAFFGRFSRGYLL